MIDACKKLVASHFPLTDSDEIDMILLLCAKNEGLFCLPDDKPEYLFGYYRFYPVLAEAIDIQDFSLLLRCDLTIGPLVYIAVLIAPREGYSLTRQLLNAIDPQPYAFCCHRHKKGERGRFRCTVNSRRKGGCNENFYENHH